MASMPQHPLRAAPLDRTQTQDQPLHAVPSAGLTPVPKGSSPGVIKVRQGRARGRPCVPGVCRPEQWLARARPRQTPFSPAQMWGIAGVDEANYKEADGAQTLLLVRPRPRARRASVLRLRATGSV